MRSKIFGIALSAAVVAALALPLVAAAHTQITVSPYTLEVGWVDEPPLVGAKNGVSIGIVTTADNKPVDNVSTLVVTISTGGRDKQLELGPAGEDTPGQYIADFIPTVRGVYAVKLSGKIESTDVNTSVDIEEAVDAASLQFPEPLPDAAALSQALSQAQTSASNANSVATIGIVLGVLGILIGGFAVLRGRRA